MIKCDKGFVSVEGSRIDLHAELACIIYSFMENGVVANEEELHHLVDTSIEVGKLLDINIGSSMDMKLLSLLASIFDFDNIPEDLKVENEDDKSERIDNILNMIKEVQRRKK